MSEKNYIWDVIVIGGGAAGLIASGKAAENGAQVILVEKNSILGKKVLITGKGRCNITNAGELEDLIGAFGKNGNFLYSAFSVFSNHDTVNFFKKMGIATKIERGKRVFPESDQANDVVTALVNYAKKNRVKFALKAPVDQILIDDKKVKGIQLADGTIIYGNQVVLATGGSSYPATGSTGDGYQMAKSLGHKITPIKPALVPLVLAENWAKELQGLTLKNVELSIMIGTKKKTTHFGEMLFTHFGISGPIVLTMSKEIQDQLNKTKKSVLLNLDLKPALSEEKLDMRIQRDFEKNKRKQLLNSLNELLPNAMIPIMLEVAEIDSRKFVHQITKQERKQLVKSLKNLPMTVLKTRPLSEAIVTAGGVHIREVNPQTMESKLISGLYIVGECLDLDGITGGFNLQAAFSTGIVAGISASKIHQ